MGVGRVKRTEELKVASMGVRARAVVVWLLALLLLCLGAGSPGQAYVFGGGVEEEWTENEGRRQLSSMTLLADMAVPLVLPMVDIALKPVQRIILEWVVDPISYQISKIYVEDAEQNIIAEEEEEDASDFWGDLGSSIQEIFLIDDSGGDEEGGSVSVNLSMPLHYAKSNEGLRHAHYYAKGRGEASLTQETKVTSDSSSGLLRRVVLDRVATKPAPRSTKDLSVFAQALTRTMSKAVGFPSKVSVLKCGKISGSIREDSLDNHLVAGNEAKLVMKLEGFTPRSPVVLFGSQTLAGEHGLPVPRITSGLVRRALETLDESVVGKATVNNYCEGIQLGIGGLTETIDMSLDTPHKIVMIVNHTNQVRTTIEG
jgi:hypothetical protein